MIDPIVHASEPVLLVGGGPVAENDLAAALSRFGMVVAADGGAHALLDAGRRPDAVIGDLDSLSDAARAALPEEIVHGFADQESTDFDKCLAAIEAPVIVAMGFLGERIDHQLAVFTGLARQPGQPCMLVGTEDVVGLCPPDLKLGLPRDTRVSLWPLAEVRGHSEGLHWPIDGIRFAPASIVGTSNRAEGPIDIAVDAPAMLIILPRSYADVLMRGLMGSPRWPR